MPRGAPTFTAYFLVKWFAGLLLFFAGILLVLGALFVMDYFGDQSGTRYLEPYATLPVYGLLLLPFSFAGLIGVVRERTEGWIAATAPLTMPFLVAIVFIFGGLGDGFAPNVIATRYVEAPLNLLAYFAIGHVAGVAMAFLKALLFPRRN